jgi:hypothetical protein
MVIADALADNQARAITLHKADRLSVIGPTWTSRDVRFSAAVGGIADTAS